MHFDPSRATLFGVAASVKWVNLIYRGKNMHVDTSTMKLQRQDLVAGDNEIQVESFSLGNLARIRYAVRELRNLRL